MTTDFKRPSSAESTPPTPEAARALRKEIEDAQQSADAARGAANSARGTATAANDRSRLLQETVNALCLTVERIAGAIDPLAQTVSGQPVLMRKLIAEEGAKISESVKEAFVSKRADRIEAIKASERRSADLIMAEAAARITADADINERLDTIGLQLGVTFCERDSRDDEQEKGITKIAADTKAATALGKQNQADVRFFTRGRLGFGALSAAVALAAKSDATWGMVKTWAWTHGLALSVAVGVVILALVVEIYTRMRAARRTEEAPK